MKTTTVNELCRRYITKEMLQRYKERTFNHIKLVQRFGILVDKNFKFKGSLANHVGDHDSDKLRPPLLQTHILSVEKYLSARDKTPVEYPPAVERAIQMCTFFHVTRNRHHPEYWDGHLNFPKIAIDEYMPDERVNAHAMPDVSMAEMCCDWASVGKEVNPNKTLIEWAEHVFEHRFDFTSDQQRFIKEVLSFLDTVRKEELLSE